MFIYLFNFIGSGFLSNENFYLVGLALKDSYTYLVWWDFIDSDEELV